jgi:hypothetical protein
LDNGFQVNPSSEKFNIYLNMGTPGWKKDLLFDIKRQSRILSSFEGAFLKGDQSQGVWIIYNL